MKQKKKYSLVEGNRSIAQTCEKIVGAFFGFVSDKGPNISYWSSMADNIVTQGGIGDLGSPFYICAYTSQLFDQFTARV